MSADYFVICVFEILAMLIQEPMLLIEHMTAISIIRVIEDYIIL